ncbi:MAG: glycine--tRNA ligase [Patescibacteria group bacterium]
MERLTSLAKQRGFIYPTAEIYGGLQGFWDWGPLGVELKNNIKRSWWKRFVESRIDVVGFDSSIITNPDVFIKSGHVMGFHDTLIECKSCHARMRPEDISEGRNSAVCPKCKSTDFTDVREFNTMFATRVGPVDNSSSIAYLRPETAQGIFVNFKNVRESMRMKLPFGIGQIGKAFRNEITPGNFIFRSREFEQMELEFFCKPADDDTWFDYWVKETEKWFLDLGLNPKHIREKAQKKGELAHYAKATIDLEYHFPFDKEWMELAGISNRQNFDLKAHKQGYQDEETHEDIFPFCIEPSIGVERAALALLLDAFIVVEGGRTTTTKSTKESEMVLKLHPSLAPIKIAILPLSRKEDLIPLSKKITDMLKSKFSVMYDDSQSIGRRYRRQDEIGTPFCITIDFDSLKDAAVTVRDRDTMEQKRIPIDTLISFFQEQLTI